MAKFEVAILNDKLIKRATRDQMWTALKPGDGSKDGYGLGWGNGDVDGIPVVSHNGGQQGTSTAFMLAPAKRSGVVVLTNMEGADAHDLAAAVMKIVVGPGCGAKEIAGARSNRTVSVPRMIGMPLQNREGTVDLLEQHHSCQFMRKSHLSERNYVLRRAASFVAETIRSTDSQD